MKKSRYDSRPAKKSSFKRGKPSDRNNAFSAVLRKHMAEHGDNCTTLHRAIWRPGESLSRATISTWVRGALRPRHGSSQKYLHRIEKRYGLPKGDLYAKAFPTPTSPRQLVIHNSVGQDGRLLNWHLPRNFDNLTPEKRLEIITWVREHVCAGTTAYGQFIIKRAGIRYSVRFSELIDARKRRPPRDRLQQSKNASVGIVEAPASLTKEMKSLLAFKSSPLTRIGLRRLNRWHPDAVQTHIRMFGVIFGCLVAHKRSVLHGLGLNPAELTFALLLFPKLIDWILRWRFNSRGFFTQSENRLVCEVMALTRRETGWIRQTPRLAKKLKPIPGLISRQDIAFARSDWNAACEIAYKHCSQRAMDLRRQIRKHRDSFEAILPILESDSPLRQYRRITEEMLRLMPDEKKYPLQAAEAMRSYLMLRLGMHLGFRPGNMRDLLLCKKNEKPKLERELVELKAAELRWNIKRRHWEVFAPAAAFKNYRSSFFRDKPFKLVLPNLAGLYESIEAYINRHRRVLASFYLLGEPEQPKTFFMTTSRRAQKSQPMLHGMFYENWRYAIQRFGIYNPYTKTGAVIGLLPHGPYGVRHVLATHILKMTGSYELASYALQNAPSTVAKHYGRFLPHDKTEQAAKILNKVWEEPAASFRRKSQHLSVPQFNTRSRPIWLSHRKRRVLSQS